MTPGSSTFTLTNVINARYVRLKILEIGNAGQETTNPLGVSG